MTQSSAELVIKSVATAVAATVIVEAGIGISKSLAKQPIVLFGLGLLTGYISLKYRKEIIAISNHTADQSKEFMMRQKQQLDEFLAEIHPSHEPKTD
jgi:hypothetical protein